jgi:cytochrome P450 family 135
MAAAVRPTQPPVDRLEALTLDVMVHVLVGADDPPLRSAIDRMLRIATSIPRMLALTAARQDIGPIRPRAQLENAIQAVDEHVYRLIGERPADGSVLAMLKSARYDDGSSLSDRELRDQLVTFATTRNQTAAALAWAIERIARHPAVQVRLREGDGAYLDAVVKEVLRVRPLNLNLSRKTLVDFELDGYVLPRGVHVMPCIYLAHRGADNWTDPAAFRPERFFDPTPGNHSFVPFGEGRRRCVGDDFALLEIGEVLRAIVERYMFRPDRPEGERMRRRAITLYPDRGARVTFEPWT